MGCYQFYNLKNPMEDKIQRLVNAANSTNAKAKEIGEMQLRELGLDNNGNPLKSASTKATKPKAERKKSSSEQTINLGGGKIVPLEDAIKMWEDKIKAQGRVTNERDEDFLSELILAFCFLYLD